RRTGSGWRRPFSAGRPKPSADSTDLSPPTPRIRGKRIRGRVEREGRPSSGRPLSQTLFTQLARHHTAGASHRGQHRLLGEALPEEAVVEELFPGADEGHPRLAGSGLLLGPPERLGRDAAGRDGLEDLAGSGPVGELGLLP